MDFHSFFFLFNSSFLFCFFRGFEYYLFGFVCIIFTSLTTEQVSIVPLMLKVNPKAMVLTRPKKGGEGEGAVGEAESSKAVWYLELSYLKFWVCPWTQENSWASKEEINVITITFLSHFYLNILHVHC